MIAILLISVGAIISLANLLYVARYFITKRSASLVPFLGALLLALGLSLYPVLPVWKAILVAVLLDFGTSVYIVFPLLARLGIHNPEP